MIEPVTNEAGALLRERDQLAESFDALGVDFRLLRAERDDLRRQAAELSAEVLGLRREAALWAERDRQQRAARQEAELRAQVETTRRQDLEAALHEILQMANNLWPLQDRLAAIRITGTQALALEE